MYATIDVAYATLISVIFHKYRISTPLKRNSSLKASRNIIAFQDGETCAFCPHNAISPKSRVIASAPMPRIMLLPISSFLMPNLVNASLMLHFSKYEIAISGMRNGSEYYEFSQKVPVIG